MSNKQTMITQEMSRIAEKYNARRHEAYLLNDGNYRHGKHKHRNKGAFGKPRYKIWG